jgi:HK97 family phage major capsid protein
MDIRSRVIALNSERLNVVEQLRTELEATAGRERSEEEATKIARLDARIDEIDTEVRDFVARETREQEAATLREQSAHLFGEAAVERAVVSADAAFRAWAQNPHGGTINVNLAAVALERDLLRQGASAEEIRALAWDTGTSATLVPTTLARTLYEYLEASIAMFRAPTTKINSASGEPMNFPAVLAHAIGTQSIAQGTILGGTDPTFTSIRLDAYDYVDLAYVHNNVLSDSGVDIGAFLGANLGRAVGRKADADLVVGVGTTNPKGIMVAAAAGSVATGGTIIYPTVDNFIDLQYAVNDEYRNSPSAGWLMNDSTAGSLRKYRDGGGGTVGAYLWEPSMTQGLQTGQPDRFLGKPVFTDPNVSAAGSGATVAAFGDMSAYYVRTVGGVDIARSDDVKFDYNQATFRAVLRADGDLIDANAVKVLRMKV